MSSSFSSAFKTWTEFGPVRGSHWMERLDLGTKMSMPLVGRPSVGEAASGGCLGGSPFLPGCATHPLRKDNLE